MTMTEKTHNILILCTHNSARSVLSEGMLNHWAKRLCKNVQAHSAGSAPSGRINPFALEALRNAGVETDGYRSKSWDEFTGDGAPPLSIVITVCDSAAAEQCPAFFGGSGQPVKVHWGYPDPSNAPGGVTSVRVPDGPLNRKRFWSIIAMLVRSTSLLTLPNGLPS